MGSPILSQSLLVGHKPPLPTDRPAKCGGHHVASTESLGPFLSVPEHPNTPDLILRALIGPLAYSKALKDGE